MTSPYIVTPPLTAREQRMLAVLDAAVAWADAQDPDAPAEWQAWAFCARALIAELAADHR